jgi:hypothetical protein
VVNPVKLGDREAFRMAVRRAMAAHGWDEPLWLETTPADPGRGLTGWLAVAAHVLLRTPPGS